MGTILQTSDYDAIRTKLGITTDDLSNTEIDSIGLLPIAEAMIEQAVTDYAAILVAGGLNKLFLQAAALSLCAALAIAKLEVQRGQSFRQAEYSESETKVDWEALRTTLMQEATSYLIRISTQVHTRRTLFVATGPTSSGTSWPLYVQQWYARIYPRVVGWVSESGFQQFGWESQP